MTKPVKITMICFGAIALSFTSCSATEVDEAAIKKDADEKADDLLHSIDASFEENSDSLQSNIDTIN